ncbi:hypothetical protein [Streptomyces sp. NPDC052292]|uniref:hypothetical protein n=1 Tax=Streptomyces sp. NPDC052292 TaxID=3155053 RepID=UPI0034286ED7
MHTIVERFGWQPVAILGGSVFVALGMLGYHQINGSSSDGVRSAKDDITITDCGNHTIDSVTVNGTINNSTDQQEGYWADIKALDVHGVVLSDITVEVLGVRGGETRTFSHSEPSSGGTAVKCVVNNATRTMGS